MPKSRWRDPSAQHFQLVHRSQRDPLIHDPEAGDRVLKQVERANVARSQAKGKSRADLEHELPSLAAQAAKRQNIGEASNYGIYFDDTEYDYMQHLRPVGSGSGALPSNASRGGVDEKDDVDAILLQAPKQRNLTKGGETPSFALKEDAAGPSQQASASSSKLQLPASALPSANEMPMSYTSHLPVEPELAGFQPDMNPHLRQTLEALDDDAFVDGDLDDDFFGEIVAGGAGQAEGPDAEWLHLPPEGDEHIWTDKAEQLVQADGEVDEADLTLEQRVALFKLKSKMEGSATAGPSKQRQAEEDEEGDELASLPSGSRRAGGRKPASSIGGSSSIFGDSKNRSRPGVKARYAASDAGKSAFSMSSSAMFRNKGLTGLDDHFDQIERQYGRGDEDGELYDEEDEDGYEYDEESEAALRLADAEVLIGENGEPIAREDFDSIMDEFLNEYEVLGGKMRQRLGASGTTGAEKLDMVRKALGEASLRDDEDDEEPPMPEVRIVGSNREKWDVESILSTRSNLENRPRVLRDEDSLSIAPSGSAATRSAYMPASISGTGSSSVNGSSAGHLASADKVPQIRIDPRTGIPKIVGYRTVGRRKGGSSTDEAASTADSAAAEEADAAPENDDEEGSDYDSDATEGPVRETITRPRDETAVEKKARKSAAKEAKQARRAQKSMTKQAFAKERKKQVKETIARTKDGAAADFGRNGIASGVLRL